jgi:hypothetical protein
MTYRTEHPEFDAASLPVIPASWEDTSWHNDACPSFRVIGDADNGPFVRLWVQYPEQCDRESDAERFLLERNNDWGGSGPASYAYRGDDAAAMLAAAEVETLAWTFADMLARDLEPLEWQVMRLRNRTAPEGICASHDFCDANMVMAEAFEAVKGCPPLNDEGMSAETVALWNAAWEVAKPHYLTATTDRTVAGQAFDAWRATGRDVADLRKYEELIGTIEHDQSGRIYDCGFIFDCGAGGKAFGCIVSNCETSTDSLIAAERFLWEHHAEAETAA